MEQMKNIGESETADSPLGKLCRDTLATIANPPGRIYDKQKLMVTPGTMVKEVAEQILQPKK